MSRIAGRFEVLRGRGQAALVPFVTAGDPAPGVTVPLMHALVEGGADMLELGVPFSDPMADGPVIQRASERALNQGMNLARVLELVAEFRTGDPDTPVVLMGYLNPYESAGYATFAASAAEAGVDGVLTVDLPPEEANPFLAELRPRGLDLIFLVAPTSDDERIERICARASGFVYYVSVKGVTGSGHLDVDEVGERVRRIKRATALPVGVGFGIRGAESAARISAVSDAVIIGSALVSRIEAMADRAQEIPGALGAFIASVRHAMDANAS